MKKNIFNVCLFFVIALAILTNSEALLARQAPSHYYYKGQAIPLQLDVERLAVRYDNELSAAEQLATLAELGVPAVTGEATGMARSVMMRLQTPLVGAADADARIKKLLASGKVSFVSPVFRGHDGGWVIMASDVLLQFHAEHAQAAEAILAVIAPELTVVTKNFGDMPGAYKLRSVARNGFEVLASANRLAEDSRLAWAEPDAIFTGRLDLIPNDPGYGSLWGISNTGQYGGVVNMDMDGDLAWDITIGSATVKVLIIDTGVQQDHPDINQLAGTDLTGAAGGGGPVNSCDNHGTAVAGCVSAAINNGLGTVGIAPGCRVLSARTFVSNLDCSGSWTTQVSWTVDALAWGEAQGARVSNNSNHYGFTSSSIEAKYQSTYDNGMVHFAAAGNNGSSAIAYPASIPVVNAVAALNPSGNLASFSNYGSGLDFSAPGETIYSTDRTGAAGYNSDDYAFLNGTSFATPYAAGVAALIISQNPSFTAAQVEARLQTTCRDLGASGYDTIYGWGFVNANHALAGSDPAVPNDDCAQAEAITALPFTDNVNTTEANPDPADPTLSCGAGGGGKTVWYTFTPVTTAVVSANTSGSNYDTVLGLFTGSCGALTEINCNDDAQGLQSEIQFTAQAGVTYFIHVAEYNSGNSGGNLVFNLEPGMPLSLFKGPASGSIAGGASVSTDGFLLTAVHGKESSKKYRPVREIGLRKDSPENLGRAAGAKASNFVKDVTTSLEGTSSSTLLNGFAGIADLGVTIPPDPHMAAGPDHVMGTVNSQFAIYNKSGVLLKLIDADTWFANVNPGGDPFDPQIVYDHHAGRWIMAWVDYTSSPAESFILLSVSDDSNPLGSWCNWRLPGNQTGATPNTLLFDYPKIGLDQDAVYVTGNMFDIVTGVFEFVQLRLIPKAQLLNNLCGGVTWTDFWDLRNPSDLTATVFTTVPAVTLGTPGVEYLVDVDFIFSTGTFMNLWSLTNPLSATPTLTAITIPVAAFTSPPDADQLGGGIPRIDVGGRRNRNVVYQNGSVWTAHSVADPTGQFAQLRYVRIDAATMTALEDVAFGADNFWYYYPAVQPDGADNLFLAFTRSGTSEYAGARFTHVPAGGTIAASSLLKAGDDNYVKTFGGSRNRWGDYMGMALDPADNSKVWMFVEYAETAVGPGSTDDRWGTWFGQVTMASFNVDTTSPPPNALNIQSATDIALTFTADANASTLTNNTIKVNGSLSGRHMGGITYNSATQTATFSPDSSFKTGEVVSVTLTTAIQSTGGGHLPHPYQWSFTVGVEDGTGSFARTQLLIINAASALVPGDFDGDGDLDVAVSNGSQNSVTIVSNNGYGDFVAASTVAVGAYPHRLATGDLDADGDLDLAVPNSDATTISILVNDGNGQFIQTSVLGVNSGPYSVITGDFDGDGDLDLAASCNGSGGGVNSAVVILKNDGSSGFTQTSSNDVPGCEFPLAAGDWDGDGDLDLAVPSHCVFGLTILSNDGSGVFSPSTTVEAGNYPSSVGVGDLDGDGDLDLVVPNRNDASLSLSTVSILKNDGLGNFTKTSAPRIGGANPHTVVLGDFDHDGDLDLAVNNPPAGTVSIMLNDGAGEFGLNANAHVGSGAVGGIGAGDFDGDGDIDLAATMSSTSGFVILKNLPPIPLPDSTAYGKIAGGDQSHADRVVYSFNGQPGEMVLHFQAYDIDQANEVDVLLNGTHLFDVPITAGKQWGDSVSVILPDGLIDDNGVNLLVFDNTRNPSKTWLWGVRRVSVAQPFMLPVSAPYGRIPGGDQAHADKVTYYFPGQMGDVALSYQAFDIDNDTEIAILLNGTQVGYVPLSTNNQWSRSHHELLPDALVNDSETNTLVFDNTKNPPKSWVWGVRQVSVQTCISMPSVAAYGKIPGGDQAHADRVPFSFAGQPGDLSLSYEGYDIDDVNEIDVFLNGTKILDADTTADNQWSSTRTSLLPDHLVKDSQTNLLVFDNTKNPPKNWTWGVRNASVTSSSVSAVAIVPDHLNEAGGQKSNIDCLFDGRLVSSERADEGNVAAPASAPTSGDCIIVEFSSTQRFDYLLLYPDENPHRYFSYQVEASQDGRQWQVVVDRSNVLLQGSQLNQISNTQARYLRISGVSFIRNLEEMQRADSEHPSLRNSDEAVIRQAAPLPLTLVELSLFRQQQERIVAGSAAGWPSHFQLAQNHPNPFNPGTTMGFSLPAAGDVTLRIYSTAGQLIRQVASGKFAAGEHYVNWDGRNAAGEQVAAGVYLYRLVVRDATGAVAFTETKRMTLLK